MKKIISSLSSKALPKELTFPYVFKEGELEIDFNKKVKELFQIIYETLRILYCPHLRNSIN